MGGWESFAGAGLEDTTDSSNRIMDAVRILAQPAVPLLRLAALTSDGSTKRNRRRSQGWPAESDAQRVTTPAISSSNSPDGVMRPCQVPPPETDAYRPLPPGR